MFLCFHLLTFRHDQLFLQISRTQDIQPSFSHVLLNLVLLLELPHGQEHQEPRHILYTYVYLKIRNIKNGFRTSKLWHLEVTLCLAAVAMELHDSSKAEASL